MTTEEVGRPAALRDALSSAEEGVEAEERSIRSQVWQIAWPSVLTFALMTTNGILDRMFVGRLGRDALAAVGVGGQVIFLLVSVSMAITVGTTALVARFTGAREPEQAAHATGQSLSLGLIVSLLCTAVVYLFLGPLLYAMRLDDGARTECRQYLQMALLGMAPMFLVGVLAAAFRGLGDTRTPLRVIVCANVVHILGDLTLMLGYLHAPALGLRGGGIAFTLSNTVAFIVYVLILRRSALREAARWEHLNLRSEWARRILKIGIPAAFTALLRVTSLMGFTFVLAQTAERMSAVASLPIGLTAESIAFMPGFGFSMAASALVGQALGARRPDKAERYGWAATWQAVTIMTFMGGVFYLFAEPFARVFSHDPTVVPLAVRYLRIMAFSEPFLGIGMVLTGALQGAGETVKPAILTAFSFWGFRMPAAWLLALKLSYNTTGAWVAMSATTALGGMLTILLYRDDSWKRIKV